ncbi:mitogen-activated protein kinase kinase kinase 20 [Trichonephila clavipes]|nr:mitogen-activated protein kinase kinase kinase 20 [Trichonephila clavipes]
MISLYTFSMGKKSNFSLCKKAEVNSLVNAKLFSNREISRKLKISEASVRRIKKKIELTIPKCCPPRFAELMTACWRTDPKERPSFSEILKVLCSMQNDANSNDLDQYADLFLEQQINGKRLLLMTSEDLKDMGVLTVGHRIHLMSIVKKPRFTQHFHQVVAEGNCSLQKEVVLTLRGLSQSRKKQGSNTPQCRSAPIIPDVWQNRFRPESFSLPQGKTERGAWAKVVAGDTTIPPLQKKKFESFVNSGSSSEGDSIFESMKSIGRQLLEDTQPISSRMKKVSFTLHSSSSSESIGSDSVQFSSKVFKERRQSTPTCRPRFKYRHSASDSGFPIGNDFKTKFDKDARFVKFRECRIRLQSEMDRFMTDEKEGSSFGSVTRKAKEAFSDPVEDALGDFPLNFRRRHKGISGRGGLFRSENGEPQLRSWSLDRNAL